jgi:class 3 adenylate cyclase
MILSQRPIFAPRLSFKITIPYAALALILGLATLYVIASRQAANVTAEFSRQIDDARVRVGDSVVRTEQAQIANVRTIARVTGLAQAVREDDSAALIDLVTPFAVSQNIERIIIVDGTGHVLAAVRSHDAEVSLFTPSADITGWPGVASVLQHLQDAQGDKYIDLVDDNGELVLYTVAPIFDGDTQAGAMLIGTTASTLVERWRATTLADITLYAADGSPVTTSLGADVPGTLDAGARGETPYYRVVMLGSRDYGEIVAPLTLRGALRPQFIGVALSTAGQDVRLEQAQVGLVPIFILGLTATFLLGIILSKRITRPIIALVRAAEGVAAGNLDHVLPVVTGDEIGALTTSFNTMIGGLRERERMHDIFGRFVSPTVARLVLSNPLDLSGETKLLSILFTDLRDFTALSEREEPAVVIKGLNDYFRVVVEAADRYGGIVNKFGGDSTLVLFGLTDVQPDAKDSAEAAVQASLAIRAGLCELNARRAEEGAPLLVASVGVNTGMVVAGLIGAERRMEYTAIGDAVNLSSRIQTLNRKLETDILVSEATYQALQNPPGLHVIDRGLRRLKGKSTRIRVYEISCWEADDAA